ncbi:hypothetical protein [Polaromonas sp. CG9_12]|nr:hypothetical protein [Polaromonas sp. CG9_12]
MGLAQPVLPAYPFSRKVKQNCQRIACVFTKISVIPETSVDCVP